MLFALLLACPKTPDETALEDSEGPVEDPATVELAGPCPMDTDLGGFSVTATDATDVAGTVSNGVVPITILENIGTDGDCVLLRRNNPHCEPACDPGQTCDWEGECIAYPSNQDLGVVTIDGLAQPVEMEPVFPGNTYFDTTLPHPAMTPGELVTLRMPEGTYGPARMHGVAVDPLTGLAEEWSIEAGVDLELTWDATVTSPARSEVWVSVNIDQHGVSPGTLFCTFEDDGAGTVSGALIEQMVSVGVTGFPSGSIVRRTVDHADAGDGCMDFTVSSRAGVAVDVIGFTPCTSTAECPDGLVCNTELQICEDP